MTPKKLHEASWPYHCEEPSVYRSCHRTVGYVLTYRPLYHCLSCLSVDVLFYTGNSVLSSCYRLCPDLQATPFHGLVVGSLCPDLQATPCPVLQVSRLAGVVRDVCARSQCQVVLDVGSGLVGWSGIGTGGLVWDRDWWVGLGS